MTDITAEELAKVNSFPRLVDLLRDKLEWPIPEDYGLEDVVFEYEPRELGLKDEDAAKLREIHQLRPLVTNQPWGIFFLSFEDKTMSVTVLRRILRALVVSKRGESKGAERAAWDKRDLIFAANFGKSGERELAFVHFNDGASTGDLPVMKVLGWNAKDTKLHNEYAAKMLASRLAWPDDTSDDTAWRTQWSSAFEIGYRQVIKTSRDLALHLAGLATQIRARANELLEAEADDGPMRTMLEAFRKNLIHDLDEDGFADMFAQTICYGMLAAAISRPSGALVAENMADMVPRTNPFLKELFANFLKLGGRDKRSNLDFDELGVREVVDMLQRADMPAVLRDFGDRNPKEDPVIHFYELFLKEYDPAKRMQRGVFYTPRPVVNFIVRGVDEILRTEFDLPLGLADTTTWGELAARNDKITIPGHIDPDQPFVQILDPATGTGTFLVEVIDLIHNRMVGHWQDAGKSKAEIAEAWNEYVPAHLLPRLTAFELMMAPYSIAHMKVGLKLSETGYKFASDERARIFLANALEPPSDLDMQFDFMGEALAHEAKAANSVKTSYLSTVFIGNPPYSKISSNLTDAAISLVESYRFLDGERIVERGALAFEMALQDDYIKFFGLAHKYLKIISHQVIGMISNSRYLNGIYLRGMRDQKIKNAKGILSIDLGGQVSERAEIEGPDENVFDIEQGVAISLGFQYSGVGHCVPTYERVSGNRENKYEALLRGPNALQTRRISPRAPLYLLKPLQNALAEEYAASPELREIMPANSGAIITSRDALVIDLERDSLSKKILKFGDINLSNEDVKSDIGFSAKSSWNLSRSRKSVEQDIKKGSSEEKYRKILYRPWDVRHIYYDPRIIDTPSKPISEELYAGDNLCLCTPRIKNTDRFNHVLASELPAEKKAASHDRATQMFPLFFEESESSDGAFRRPNIAKNVGELFERATSLSYNDGIPRGKQQSMGTDYRHEKAEQISLLDQPWDGRGNLEADFGPRDLFDWIYAILHAPSYRSRYAEFLKSDFPRIPTPGSRALFADLVSLGHELVALHLLKPDEATVLKTPEIRFCGSGEARVAKGYPEYENGKVKINASRWFEDVPQATYEFHVGGYQPCEKWLKDRAAKGGKNPSDGRVLTEEDILHYRRMVTALTETRRIMAEIDKVIETHGGWPGAFAIGNETGEGA